MKSYKIIALFMTLLMVISIVSFTAVTVFADDGAAASEETDQASASAGDAIKGKAIAAAIVVGLAATGGAIGMGMAISKSAESMARQPEAAGKINSAMMLGLVFIETVVIYALIVAILIIFVL
ncbi:MAG: ATP synthase F0 subunit C [Clostridia bacterium]|nr:ATP synthase F0 subunit C [Clostridia bacterium]